MPIQTVHGVTIEHRSNPEQSDGIPRNSKTAPNIITASQHEVRDQQKRTAPPQDRDKDRRRTPGHPEAARLYHRRKRTIAQSPAEWGADEILRNPPAPPAGSPNGDPRADGRNVMVD